MVLDELLFASQRVGVADVDKLIVRERLCSVNVLRDQVQQHKPEDGKLYCHLLELLPPSFGWSEALIKEYSSLSSLQSVNLVVQALVRPREDIVLSGL